MKLLTVSIIIGLLLVSSGCIKEDFPVIENITKGSKWNIHIRDSFEKVYKELQELGIEKDFQSVALVYRKPFNDPAEIQESLPFYHLLTIESSAGRVDRVIIGLEDGLVTSLAAGGALPTEVDQWPRRAVESAIIRKGDSLNQLNDALEAIHKISDYAGYKYILQDKPIDLPFDPDMKSYSEWAFTFFKDRKDPGKGGRSQVRLFFKDGKLERIHHVYDEFEVVHSNFEICKTHPEGQRID